MKILVCHNYYQQRGGEDQSFEDETSLLESRGNEVIRYTRHNREIDAIGKLQTGIDTFWSRKTYREVRELLKTHKPDLVHCTNTFPLVSPSVYYACRDENTPVVQALRNYRLFCPAFSFLRNGEVCEACLDKSFAWPAVYHGCYRESRAATAVLAGSYAVHRAMGTWSKMVSLYYTLTQFAREKFIQAGMPAEKIVVKPNFIDPDPGVGAGKGGYAVFVGRLSQEKGLGVLLEAWRKTDGDISLKIIGDGPLAEAVSKAAAEDSRIEYLGAKPLPEVMQIVGDAAALICPSIWYETFGRVITEAFAAGTPAIASRLGAMAELIDDGRTGYLFEPGDADDLSRVVTRFFGESNSTTGMRQAARNEFESRYTADINYQALMNTYRAALGHPRLLPETSSDTAVTETALKH